MDKEVRLHLGAILTTATKLAEEYKGNAEANRDYGWLSGWYAGRGAVYGVVAKWVQEVLDLQDAADTADEVA